MSYSEEEVEILEEHHFIKYVDRCLFCKNFEKVKTFCTKLRIKVTENGWCELFSM